MQHGAIEYLLKPVQFDALNVAIEKCLGHRRLQMEFRPDILKKPGKLTYDEFEAMKLHTVNGAAILSQSPTLDLASSIALSHHERHDGKGYPHGIGSEDIPVEARIPSVADVFDALTMKRCYKEVWSIDKAVGMIEEERGKQFNPEVVDAFIGSLDHIRSIRQQLSE